MFPGYGYYSDLKDLLNVKLYKIKHILIIGIFFILLLYCFDEYRYQVAKNKIKLCVTPQGK